MDFLKTLEKRHENFINKRCDFNSSFIPSGFKDLDKILSPGFTKYTLNVIGARPAMGKTTFALNLAMNMAKAGKTVKFLSLEMTEDQLLEHLLASEAEVGMDKIRTGELDGEEYQKVVFAANSLSKTSFHFYGTDVGRESKEVIDFIDANSESEDVFFLDCINLISHEPKNLYQEHSQFISKIKEFAINKKVTFFILTPLNKDVEKRQGHTPTISDIPYSLENDADLILLLLRREFYDPSDKPGLADLFVAKNRHGLTTQYSSPYATAESIWLIFKNNLPRFYDYKPFKYNPEDRQESDAVSTAAFYE